MPITKKFFCRKKKLNSFRMIHDWKWTEGTFDFVLFFIGCRFPPQFAKKKSNEIIRCLLLQYSEYVFVHIFDDIFRKRSVRDLITGFKHDSTTCHRCTCYSCIVNERLTKRARVYRVTVTQMRAHVPYKTVPIYFVFRAIDFIKICVYLNIYISIK